MTDYDDFIDLHIPLPQTNTSYSTVIKELVETLINTEKLALPVNDANRAANAWVTHVRSSICTLLDKELDISLKHQQDYIDEYEKSKAKPELTGNVTELKPKGK